MVKGLYLAIFGKFSPKGTTMQIQSNSYNPYTDIRTIDLQVTFGVVDTTAEEDATGTASDEASTSVIEQTYNGITEMSGAYRTLERNMFVLDGNSELYPSNGNPEVGWQSGSISGDNCTFTSNPYIDFTFTENHSSYGLTLHFDDKVTDDFPSEVLIEAFDSGGSLLDSKTVYPTSPFIAVGFAVTNYRRIRLTFIKTSQPHRRARLCECVFGLIYTYDKNTIGQATYRSEIDVTSESQPTTEFEVTINNTDYAYNMLNPSGIYAYLQEGQTADVRFIINDESIDMGALRFTSAKTSNDGLTATLTFNDFMSLLDNRSLPEGDGATSTLQSLVASLNLGIEINYNGLGSTQVKNAIAEGTTYREALREWSQASRCYSYIDRDGVLQFVSPAFTTAEEEWTLDVQQSEAIVTVKQGYDAIILQVGESRYVSPSGTTPSRPLTISNDCVVNGQSVADWLWAWVQKRNRYECTTRGNPALDNGDCVQIDDIFGVNATAILTSIGYDYAGGLSCKAEAIR